VVPAFQRSKLNAGFLDNASGSKPDPGEKTFSPSSPKAVSPSSFA
jgi:hypothetical protein